MNHFSINHILVFKPFKELIGSDFKFKYFFIGSHERHWKFEHRFMHELWTHASVNMTYTRVQNYTNMMVTEHENANICSCGCCVVNFAIGVWCFYKHKMNIPYHFWPSGLSKNTYMLVCTIPISLKYWWKFLPYINMSIVIQH